MSIQASLSSFSKQSTELMKHDQAISLYQKLVQGVEKKNLPLNSSCLQLEDKLFTSLIAPLEEGWKSQEKVPGKRLDTWLEKVDRLVQLHLQFCDHFVVPASSLESDLYRAIEKGHTLTACALIREGAYYLPRGEALMMALEAKDEDIAIHLIEAGADTSYEDEKGKKALDLAEDAGLTRVLKYLN